MHEPELGVIGSDQKSSAFLEETTATGHTALYSNHWASEPNAGCEAPTTRSRASCTAFCNASGGGASGFSGCAWTSGSCPRSAATACSTGPRAECLSHEDECRVAGTAGASLSAHRWTTFRRSWRSSASRTAKESALSAAGDVSATTTTGPASRRRGIAPTPRTTMTGHSACMATCAATEPTGTRANRPSPRDPSTRTSARPTSP